MIRTTLKIDGMHCGMCETRVNELLRGAVDVKKVNSSHAKGETVILSEAEIDETRVRAVLEGQGYRVTAMEKEPYEKKKLFAWLKK